MVKQKKRVAEAAEAFARDMVERFPGLEPEIIFESVGGGDVFIRIAMPPGLRDLYLDILDVAADLTFRYLDETGVRVVTATSDKEAVPNA